MLREHPRIHKLLCKEQRHIARQIHEPFEVPPPIKLRALGLRQWGFAAGWHGRALTSLPVVP